MRATTNDVSIKASANRLFSWEVKVDVGGEVFRAVDGDFAKLGHQTTTAICRCGAGKFPDNGIESIQPFIRDFFNFSFDQFLGNHEPTPTTLKIDSLIRDRKQLGESLKYQ